MGSVCSSGEDARHHRENHKNRINPTETYDKWQQKMLLDIGADPLAVIRDFPRMTVFVHTNTSCHSLQDYYHPINDCTDAALNRKPQQQEQPRLQSPINPLVPRNRSQSHPNVGADAAEHGVGGAAGMEGESRQQQRRRKRMEKCSSSALHMDTSTGAKVNANASVAWTSPTASPLVPPRSPSNLMPHGSTKSQRPSRQELSLGDDVFAARMQRVRDCVLLLSELCNERATFGASFESSWDRLVMHGSGGGRGSNAANEPSPEPTHHSRPPSSAKQVRKKSITLDVHQILLNACVDSGMLMLVEETNSAPTLASPLLGSAQPRLGASALAPLSLQPCTPPGLVNHTFQPNTSSASGLQPGSANTTTELTAGGATAPNHSALSSDHPPMPEAGADRQQRNRGPVASASSTPASMVRPSRATALNTTPGRYIVRSATFHLMQFTTQGVMFFPVQRLKHILWMPWSSHMQDVAWMIHFHVVEATPENLAACKQHHLNTLCNTPTSLLSPHADSEVEAVIATVAGVYGHRNSLSETRALKGGTADAEGGKLPSISDADTHTGRGHSTCGADAADGVRNGKLILIRHIQTGRHYVVDSERKTTPRYELDWACNIVLDQDTLLKVFAPYQEYAAAARDAAAAAPSAPLSSLRNPTVAQKKTTETAYSALHAHQHPCDNNYETVNGDAPTSDTTSDNVAEMAFPRRPVAVPATMLDPELLTLDFGVRAAQQPLLLRREVVCASVEVLAARMEKPPHTLFMVSPTWCKRKEELDYVLKQQYRVQLAKVNELPKKMLY
nr:unnamed protein product [Leishmania braziliensis]